VWALSSNSRTEKKKKKKIKEGERRKLIVLERTPHLC
jgi:hypothetical protein